MKKTTLENQYTFEAILLYLILITNTFGLLLIVEILVEGNIFNKTCMKRFTTYQRCMMSPVHVLGEHNEDLVHLYFFLQEIRAKHQSV